MWVGAVGPGPSTDRLVTTHRVGGGSPLDVARDAPSGCAPAPAVDVSRETRQWRRFRWTYEGFGCFTADRSDGGGRVRSGACGAWCIGTGLSIVDASLEHQQRSARCAEASSSDPFGWCDIGDFPHAYVCRRVMQRGGGLRCSRRFASGVYGRGSWCAGECISRRSFAEEHSSPYGTFASPYPCSTAADGSGCARRTATDTNRCFT